MIRHSFMKLNHYPYKDNNLKDLCFLMKFEYSFFALLSYTFTPLKTKEADPVQSPSYNHKIVILLLSLQFLGFCCPEIIPHGNNRRLVKNLSKVLQGFIQLMRIDLFSDAGRMEVCKRLKLKMYCGMSGRNILGVGCN